jgi:hypothetical protein
MIELALTLFCAASSLGLSFWAGLTYRDRRHQRAQEMAEVVFLGMEQRLNRLESLIKLSSDL